MATGEVQLPEPPQLLLRTLFPADSIPDGLSLYRTDGDHTIPTPASAQLTRPHVTLTFAQSIDAKIAGKGGKQLALSGRESLIMTHWMRTMHDAILVGIGTALNDDPQLNTRHLPPLQSGSAQSYHLPRPVILDTHLRMSPTCKLLRNYKESCGRRPWVFASRPTNERLLGEWSGRKQTLENAGVAIHVVEGHNGLVSLPHFLQSLRHLGTRSLMVEGGAKVIQSFLTEQLVDTIIVTVAPVFVGVDGVGYHSGLPEQLSKLRHVKTEVFGRDVVMALNLINA